MSQDERLIDIESRIAHQDHSIQAMGDEIYRQQKKLDQLEATCDFLVEQLKTQAGASSPTDPGSERPPHY